MISIFDWFYKSFWCKLIFWKKFFLINLSSLMNKKNNKKYNKYEFLLLLQTL